MCNYVFYAPLQHFAALCSKLPGFAVIYIFFLLFQWQEHRPTHLYVGFLTGRGYFKISINTEVVIKNPRQLYAIVSPNGLYFL